MLRFFYFLFFLSLYPPLAQACSLCSIQNSLTYLTCPKNLPVRLALPPIQNSEFKIHKKNFGKAPSLAKVFYETLIIFSNTTNPLLYVSH